jgi:polyisoprenoid-binding protein YceI
MALKTTKSSSRVLSLLFLLPVFLAGSGYAATADLSAGQSHVEFEAIGRPSMLKIRGHGDHALKGNLQLSGGKLSGRCSFSLESLTTGIAMRDDHMKHRYLETAKYPTATLTFSRFAVSPAGGENLPFEGELTLHGGKKKVSGTASVGTDGGQLRIDASFEMALGDYGIAQPSFSGITVAKTVKLHVVLSAPLKAR